MHFLHGVRSVPSNICFLRSGTPASLPDINPLRFNKIVQILDRLLCPGLADWCRLCILLCSSVRPCSCFSSPPLSYGHALSSVLVNLIRSLYLKQFFSHTPLLLPIRFYSLPAFYQAVAASPHSLSFVQKPSCLLGHLYLRLFAVLEL